MKRLAILAMLCMLAVPARANAQSTAPVAAVGQVLAVSGGFLAFTTGESVRLAPAVTLPRDLKLGAFVRVLFDPVSHLAVAVQAHPAALVPGDVEVVRLPRAYVAAAPASRRATAPAESASGTTLGRTVTVTLEVRVPDNTPPNDDVFLSTDRTNYGPAEIRMLRVDARTWSASVQVPAGTQLRYEFTRGSFPTIERDRLGGIIVPRALTADKDVTARVTVARWADV